MNGDFFTRGDVLAVVGVSRDREKYGNRVFRFLRDRGFVVFPVNPKLEEVEGVRCFSSLRDLDVRVDIVVFVVPPKVVVEVLKVVEDLGLKKVWMQPGSESVEAIRFCEEKGIGVVHDACIMVAAERL